MIEFLNELGLNEVKIFLVSYNLSSNRSLEKFKFSIEITDKSNAITLSILNNPYKKDFPNRGNFDSSKVKGYIHGIYKNINNTDLKSYILKLLSIIFKNDSISENLFHNSRGVVFKPSEGKIESL